MNPSTRNRRHAWLAALLPGLAALAAHAQQTDLAVGASSSLLSRGILLGRDEPSVQASAAYYAPGGGYAALSVATLRFPFEHDRALQVVAKAGWLAPLSADWVATASVQRIAYPFDPEWRGFAYDELSVGLAYADLAVGSVSLLRHADEDGSGGRTSTAFDLVGRYPLGHGLAASAGVGYHDLQRRYGYRYAYGHAGLGLRRGSASLDLAYTLTDATAKARLGANAADRWTATVAWHF